MKLKNLIIATSSLILMLFVTACSDDALNISPAANNTSNDFYQDESQVNQGVLAIYNSLMAMTNNNWIMSDVRSDNALEAATSAQRDPLEVGNFRQTSQTGAIQATWSTLYTQIYRANIILEKIEPFKFTRVPQFKAEARFLRALAYFDLVRYFGDVPLVTKVLGFAESKTIPRESITNVYNLIIEDLKYAAANLPETYPAADKGRATKWAAKAILGRVYLTMAGHPLKQADKLALAKAEFTEVIAKEVGNYPMATNFADMFKAANDNKHYIFEIQYMSGNVGLGNPAAGIMAFQFPSQWSAFQPGIGFDAQVQPQLTSKWPNLDKRKFATLDTGYTDSKTGAKSSRVQITKFLEKGSTLPANINDQPNNFPIIRLEDVLLMQAEILNEESAASPQALTYVNRIRKRAGLSDTTATTQAALRLIIEQERQYEFVGEGLRWFDLVRTGRALEVMNKHFKDNAVPINRILDDHDLLYPIPAKELLINPGFWKQNPGYN